MDSRGPINRRHRLSALWTSTMFLYVYGDFFGLFLPGRMAEMNRGIIGPLGEATPGVLVGVAMMMAIPALMIAMTLILPRPAARGSNLVFGLAYSAIMALTLPGAEPFYLTLAAIEIPLTLGIAWLAWRWSPAES